MKDSSLLKWTQNNKLTGNSEKKEKKEKKPKDEKNKNWLHTPENLTSGHIAYLVKVIIIIIMTILPTRSMDGVPIVNRSFALASGIIELMTNFHSNFNN